MASQPVSRGSATPVIIGLDFGTHSTKVLIRQRNEKHARIVSFGKTPHGYAPFTSPSLVRLLDGKLFFGRKAAETTGGTLYRSLKVQLLPPPSEKDNAVTSFPKGPAPDFLVACYLSCVLQQVRAEVDALGAPLAFVNVAAPMNHVVNESLKCRYLQIVQTAWESTFGHEPFAVKQGATLDSLKAWFQPCLEREVPSIGHRKFEVLPETVAPIVSLSLDPRMQSGMYLIIDMGAGTTELSVNHVNDLGSDQRVLCYFDESILLGGDNFHWAEVDPAGDPQDVVRRQHGLLNRLVKAHKRVWAVGYRKDSANYVARKRWINLTVLFAGGGTRRREVGEFIRASNPQYAFSTDDIDYRATWHQPTGIRLATGEVATKQDDLGLFAVAHGLSLERQKWPVVFEPGDIEPLEGVAPSERPSPYWYVEGK